MISAITNLLGLTHTDPALKTLAEILANVEESLLSKTISTQEYVALMVEVERLRKVIDLANDLELAQTIHAAITGLIELAKTAKVI